MNMFTWMYGLFGMDYRVASLFFHCPWLFQESPCPVWNRWNNSFRYLRIKEPTYTKEKVFFSQIVDTYLGILIYPIWEFILLQLWLLIPSILFENSHTVNHGIWFYMDFFFHKYVNKYLHLNKLYVMNDNKAFFPG